MGPPRHVKDIDDFNMLLTMLTAAIQSAADQCVLKTKPSPFTKRWWTKELSDLRQQKKKLRAKSYRLCAQRYHPVHDQAIKITDEYAKSLETTKRKHWDDWLKEVHQQTHPPLSRPGQLWPESQDLQSPPARYLTG